MGQLGRGAPSLKLLESLGAQRFPERNLASVAGSSQNVTWEPLKDAAHSNFKKLPVNSSTKSYENPSSSSSAQSGRQFAQRSRHTSLACPQIGRWRRVQNGAGHAERAGNFEHFRLVKVAWNKKQLTKPLVQQPERSEGNFTYRSTPRRQRHRPPEQRLVHHMMRCCSHTLQK